MTKFPFIKVGKFSIVQQFVNFCWIFQNSCKKLLICFFVFEEIRDKLNFIHWPFEVLVLTHQLDSSLLDHCKT